jgi:hypothetical protein
MTLDSARTIERATLSRIFRYFRPYRRQVALVTTSIGL